MAIQTTIVRVWLPFITHAGTAIGTCLPTGASFKGVTSLKVLKDYSNGWRALGIPGLRSLIDPSKWTEPDGLPFWGQRISGYKLTYDDETPTMYKVEYAWEGTGSQIAEAYIPPAWNRPDGYGVTRSDIQIAILLPENRPPGSVTFHFSESQ